MRPLTCGYPVDVFRGFILRLSFSPGRVLVDAGISARCNPQLHILNSDSCLYAVMFSALIYSFLLLGAHVFAINAQELFQEQLTLRTHRDGTVLGHFAFKTILKGAAPRNPEATHVEDDCACCLSVCCNDR